MYVDVQRKIIMKEIQNLKHKLLVSNKADFISEIKRLLPEEATNQIVLDKLNDLSEQDFEKIKNHILSIYIAIEKSQIK